MVLNGNYAVGTTPAPAAILANVVEFGLIPVCGAMRRSHLIKE